MNFVPFEKRSKKEKHGYNRKRRGTFEQMGCLNPVSRVIPDKKHGYSRAVFKRGCKDDG